jgi:hypothetical protein
MLFLVHYDRKESKVMFFKEYQDSERVLAYQEQLALEMKHNLRDGSQEIVLLEASNKDQLLKTHPKYYVGSTNGEKLFIAALVLGMLALLKS